MADAKHVLDLLKRSGSQFEGYTGTGHPKWRLPDGRHYTLPCNPKDNRAWNNSASVLKKLLAGYLPEVKKKSKKSTAEIKAKTQTQNAPTRDDSVILPADDASTVEIRSIQQQLVAAGIAKPPKPPAEVMRPFRHRYEEDLPNLETAEEKQEEKAEAGSSPLDAPRNDSEGYGTQGEPVPPLHWHSIKPSPLGQKRDNRRCLVATPELLARANEILKTEGEAAYREFMKNPEIKSKLEEKEIPMAPKRIPAPPTVTISVKKEKQEAVAPDPTLAAVEAARHALLTIDSEIKQEYLLAEQHNQKAKALEQRKKDLSDTVDAFRLLKEMTEKHADLVKPMPVEAPETREVPMIITSEMVLKECASLLDREKNGATNDLIWCRFTENHEGIENIVDKKTISQRTAFLCDKGLLERVGFGVYRYTEEAQRIYGPKQKAKAEAAANGHSSTTIIADAGQSSVVH